MFKENDFIEIEFTIKVKNTLQVIETTSEKIAKENKIYNSKQKYSPKIICLGQHQIFPELEKELESKELNEEYEIELSPEKAFGKKNPKLLQLLSMSNFRAKNIAPYPGLVVNIDNMLGIVRTVSGGRVVVDFNHPLSGKIIIAKIKILRLVDDIKEKISSIISYYTSKFDLEIKDSEAVIKANLNELLKKELEKKITELVPIIKKINIVKE